MCNAHGFVVWYRERVGCKKQEQGVGGGDEDLVVRQGHTSSSGVSVRRARPCDSNPTRAYDVIDSVSRDALDRRRCLFLHPHRLGMTSALPPLVQACSGAFGSAAANAVSYPLDLVATKLQTTNSRKLRGLRGIPRILQHILSTEGPSGLYGGLGADTASTIVSKYVC